jgi:hypothetical protein
MEYEKINVVEPKKKDIYLQELNLNELLHKA